MLTVGSLAACAVKQSDLNSRRDVIVKTAETTVELGDQDLKVRLSPEDSLRLSKVFSKMVIQPVDPAPPQNPKLYASTQDDLAVKCENQTDTVVQKLCTVSIKLKPAVAENFLVSDAVNNEYMFHLRSPADAKKLYSVMNVKEWDLQGSMYKRFSTSDNRMILECILDDVRTRCSIYLSDGKSDDSGD